MTEVELVVRLKEEVKGLTNYLTDPTDYDNAVADAGRETGWTFPISVEFKEYWYKERCKRHLYNYLRAEAAAKFRAKKFNLNERFDHYHELIKQMDLDFLAIMESRPEMFADANIYDMFGSKIDASFRYDNLGRDTTYNNDNLVTFDPSESS